MPHAFRTRTSLLLGLALAGCQAAAPASTKGRTASTAPALGASASPSTVPSASAKPDAAASSTKASLGVPARVHLAMPPAVLKGSTALLLGESGVGLLANDGASLIANDGAALLANDGASLIANDGSSLIANDGASLVANDGASYRLAQNMSALGAVDLFIQLWDPQQDLKQLLQGTITLYGAQALYLEKLLTAVGQLKLVSGTPVPMRLKIPVVGGAQDEYLVNVVSRPSRTSPTHPILWLYKLEEPNLAPGGPFPAEPFLALEVTAPGQARLLWRPPFGQGGGRGFWFSTRFDLAAKRASADLLLRGLNGEQRRLAWDFTGSGSSDAKAWRSHWTAVVDSPSKPTSSAYRRAILQGTDGPEVLAAVQSAPMQATWPGDGAFIWIGTSGVAQPQAIFHSLDGEGGMNVVAEGPTPGGPGFGQEGLRDAPLQSLSRPDPQNLEPTFVWPEALPDTSAFKPVPPN